MNVCDRHWQMLRDGVDAKGMGDLVTDQAIIAAKRTALTVEQGKDTLASFDPLLFAFFNLGSNGMHMISAAGANPLYLMTEGPEDPIEGPKGEGRTWPKCVVCYMSIAHEITCDGDPRCTLDLVDGYDWMVDKAVEAAEAKWKELKADIK